MKKHYLSKCLELQIINMPRVIINEEEICDGEQICDIQLIKLPHGACGIFRSSSSFKHSCGFASSLGGVIRSQSFGHLYEWHALHTLSAENYWFLNISMIYVSFSFHCCFIILSIVE
ncbi:hypothetical protein ACJX0J_014248, partial [Zea mays]